MKDYSSELLFRWVWEANRGKPVGENATFVLGENNNLVLVDADGRITWQTNTANKGVVGFKLLPNDYMVLHDAKEGSIGGTTEIARSKYNSILSILRLEMDGNLRVYTYSDKVDWATWEVTFTLFVRNSPYALWDTKCQFPERCGNFGLCEDRQCVACPTPKGLLGWSENCKQAKTNCGSTSYCKLEGVDHFLSKYTKGDGPMIIDACGSKCTKDCKCLGC